MQEKKVKERKETKSVAEKKKLTRNDLILIIVASVLLVAIAVSVTLAIVSYVRKNTPVDFLNDNLDRYININEEDYRGYKIEINVPAPGNIELQHDIITQLAKHKGSLLNEGKYSTDETIDPGDKAYIWYTGYEIDENGKRIDLAGTSNFGDSSADEITVGLSDLVVGFDLALVGKIPADYSTFKKITFGSVAEGDVAYLTATYVLETGDYYENVGRRRDAFSWNVAMDETLTEADVTVEELEGDGYVWEQPRIRLHVPCYKAPYSCCTYPRKTYEPFGDRQYVTHAQTIALEPYGCTNLRVTYFPRADLAGKEKKN